MLKKKYIGALTDKLYAFKNRPWELSIINTLDIYDALGSNIKVYIYGSEIKRILPLKNDFINEEWISNKTRYFFEGLIKWRINIPLMRKNKIMVYISWIQAFYFFLLKIWFYSFFYKSKNLLFLNSMFTDYELIMTSKILMKKLGFFVLNKNNSINLNDYYLYFLNPNFFNDIKKKKIFGFIGYNLRLEAPILNIRLRKKMLKEDIFYFSIGSNFNDNLNSINLGINILNLIKYFQGKLNICNVILKKIKKNWNNILDLKNFFNFNLFFLGNNIISRIDNKNIYNILLIYIKNLKYLNILNNNINKNFISGFYLNYCKNNLIYLKQNRYINSELNILYMNMTSILYEEFNLFNNVHNIKNISKNDILYLLGIDFFKFKKAKFLIFQGHHLNLEYFNVDLIFPSITFFEKSSNYLNIEGTLNQTNFVLYPPVFCRNDWSILNALYIYIINFINKIYNINIKNKNFLYTNRFYVQITNFKKIILNLKKLSINFYFKSITKCSMYLYNVININVDFKLNKLYNNIIFNKYYNPYNLDIISENSHILKACSFSFNNLFRNYQNIKSLYKNV